MNLETKLNNIENLYDKAYNALLNLSIGLDKLEYDSSLSEESAEVVEKITEALADLDQEYNRQWDRFTNAHDGREIYQDDSE